MTDSMKALVEKVAQTLCMGVGENIVKWQRFTPDAKRAIRAVLDHFSEPGNVTEGMFHAAHAACTPEKATVTDIIAAAMKAAREELK
jgi:hypothetical protein